ncbi:MAG: hypothetical protein ACLT4C_10605, partial [Butyricicoccus sp.]
DELLESLAALVRIPSIEGVPEEHAPFGREPARALHEALALCEKLGFRTGNMDDRVGWCEYGEGEEMVAVLGHLDVVPAGDGWTETEPFSGEKTAAFTDAARWTMGPDGGHLRAGGAQGCRICPPSASVCCSAPTRKLAAAICRYVSHGGELPVYGFTPDGEYPISTAKRAFSTALTAESCTRPAITA